jgi:hypothetical protein
MTDESRRDRATGNEDSLDDQRDRSTRGREPGREALPRGTAPQEESPRPGDPREVQEPQEPRSTHMGQSGRQAADGGRDPDDDPDGGADPQRGVVEQLKEAWDRRRGK